MNRYAEVGITCFRSPSIACQAAVFGRLQQFLENEFSFFGFGWNQLVGECLPAWKTKAIVAITYHLNKRLIINNGKGEVQFHYAIDNRVNELYALQRVIWVRFPRQKKGFDWNRSWRRRRCSWRGWTWKCDIKQRRRAWWIPKLHFDRSNCGRSG